MKLMRLAVNYRSASWAEHHLSWLGRRTQRYCAWQWPPLGQQLSLGLLVPYASVWWSAGYAIRLGLAMAEVARPHGSGGMTAPPRVAVTAAAAAAILVGGPERWESRSGATRAETYKSLPGDGLVPH